MLSTYNYNQETGNVSVCCRRRKCAQKKREQKKYKSYEDEVE